MAGIKRTPRLSVRKSHPDLGQGRVLHGNEGIPVKKRKCVNDDGEWGPRYRSSEEDGQISFHRSWCGVEDRGEIYIPIPRDLFKG